MFIPFNLKLCHFCGIFNPSWQTMLKQLKFKLNLHGTEQNPVDAAQLEVLQKRVILGLAQFQLCLRAGSRARVQSCPSHWPVSLPFRSWLSLALEPGVGPGFIHSWIGLDLSCLTWRWTYSWNLSQESFISSPLQTTQSLSCSKSHWSRKFTTKNSLWCRDKLFPD